MYIGMESPALIKPGSYEPLEVAPIVVADEFAIKPFP